MTAMSRLDTALTLLCEQHGLTREGLADLIRPIPDTRYNGWCNYETWAVHLYLANDEGTYRYWNERAQEAAKEEGLTLDPCYFSLGDDGTLDTVIETPWGETLRYSTEAAEDYRDEETGELDFDTFLEDIALPDLDGSSDEWESAKERACIALCEQIKDEIEDGIPEEVQGLYLDLLTAAVQATVWYEVAEAFIDGLEESR